MSWDNSYSHLVLHGYVVFWWTTIYIKQKTDLIEYRKISNIRRTQNQNLNDSRLIMQLPFPNALKPGVKSRMKM